MVKFPKKKIRNLITLFVINSIFFLQMSRPHHDYLDIPNRNVVRYALSGVVTCPLKGAAPILWPHTVPMAVMKNRSELLPCRWYVRYIEPQRTFSIPR